MKEKDDNKLARSFEMNFATALYFSSADVNINIGFMAFFFTLLR